MGLENDQEQYKSIQRMIKSLVNRADIPSTVHFRHIDPITLGKIHRIARQRELILRNRAINEFTVTLKSRCKTTRRHRQVEQALEGQDLTTSSRLGAGHQGTGKWERRREQQQW
ncbi:hypothetical protein BOTBODRAFT_446048 [Botryobasidium botryosum FD-172 SS1]|uniref:Uncharacterized protein n=1 Tax=Botryobasidium botryosum (strain FD-172 SS1) TaxID=930990 RepID=A0A067M867_BOTB1|nr:hypothetical protein BOTBODRAFT_446048 [Botryobasidium botryosum FD-172 SS1]